MLDINPKGITPLGPYPEVEAGAPSPNDWKNLNPGGVKMKEVVEHAHTLPVYVIASLPNSIVNAFPPPPSLFHFFFLPALASELTEEADLMVY